MGLKKRGKKFPILWITISATVVFLVVFFFRYTPALELYPANDTYFEYSAFADEEGDTVRSKAQIDTSGGHLHFSYTLDSKSKKPFAMLLFHAHELVRTINLERYRFIDIDIDSKSSNDFDITLYMYIPGFSNPEYVETHRPYTMKCRVLQNKTHYHYPIKELATPAWWFNTYNTNDETIPKTDWKKLTHLSLSDFGDGPFNKTQHLFLKRLRFKDSMLIEAGVSFLATSLYLIILLPVLYLIRKRKNQNIKEKIYNGNSERSYTDEQSEKLITFLLARYKDPLLSHEKITAAININSIQVNDILLNKFGVKYKEYINQLRISEAKRLLVESDCQINEISEQVGFCYPNSFSRAFKVIEGVTPNQYRSNSSKG